MAITYTFAPDAVASFERLGNRKSRLGTLTLAGTYTAGGDAVSSLAFGLVRLDHIEFLDGATSAGHLCRFTPADGKILLNEIDSAAVGDTAVIQLDATESGAGTIRVRALGH